MIPVRLCISFPAGSLQDNVFRDVCMPALPRVGDAFHVQDIDYTVEQVEFANYDITEPNHFTIYVSLDRDLPANKEEAAEIYKSYIANGWWT